MDSVPPEVLDLVVSSLGDEKKAPYAAISRKWQSAVERLTFKALKVSSTEFETFSKHMDSALRRCSLTTLEWLIVLPPYSEELANEQETEDEEEANNRVFDNGNCELLGELKRWEDDMDRVRTAPTLDIYLSVRSLSDTKWPWGVRLDRSLRRLSDWKELPKVRRSAGLSTGGISRTIEGLSLARVAAAFLSVRNLNLQLWDNEKRDHVARQKHRYGK
jgi:hypothetical protein